MDLFIGNGQMGQSDMYNLQQMNINDNSFSTRLSSMYGNSNKNFLQTLSNGGANFQGKDSNVVSDQYVLFFF